jgi:pyruvate formate lyase activating enzyme
MVTGLNDDAKKIRDLVNDHLEHAGADTPLHFTRYHPEYRYDKPATSIASLESAHEAAREMGVLYPYLGNVPGHRYEDTYCHNCETLLIKRSNYEVVRNRIEDGKCPKCGAAIPGRF